MIYRHMSLQVITQHHLAFPAFNVAMLADTPTWNDQENNTVSRYWNNVQDTSPSSLSKLLDAMKAWFEERRNLIYWSCQSYL